jgi:hypothetical protein
LPHPLPLGDGTGQAADTSGMERLIVQIGGTFAADIVVEISIDGFTWFNAGQLSTGGSTILVELGDGLVLRGARQIISNYVSGTPVVKIHGHDVQSD